MSVDDTSQSWAKHCKADRGRPGAHACPADPGTATECWSIDWPCPY